MHPIRSSAPLRGGGADRLLVCQHPSHRTPRQSDARHALPDAKASVFGNGLLQQGLQPLLHAVHAVRGAHQGLQVPLQ